MTQRKKALITGSTSGIGYAIATKFAQHDIDVILHGSRPEEHGNSIASALHQLYHVNVSYARADLTKPAEIDEMMQKAKDTDILVHNAGIQYVAPHHEFPPEKMQQLLQVHLLAPLLITPHVLPHMMEKKWGRVIIMGSVHSHHVSPNKTPYITAKHGLHGYCKSVAYDYEEYGITCNEICPGFVDTDLVRKQIQEIADRENRTYDEVMQNEFLIRHANGKFVTLEEISQTAYSLCIPGHEQVNGQSLHLDGGGWLPPSKKKVLA